MAPLPDGHGTNHAFGFALEGMGYLVAGETEDGLSDAFYRYDPVSDSWTSLEDFPGDARGYAIGDVHEGKAYFGFGSSNNGKLNDPGSMTPPQGNGQHWNRVPAVAACTLPWWQKMGSSTWDWAEMIPGTSTIGGSTT